MRCQDPCLLNQLADKVVRIDKGDSSMDLSYHFSLSLFAEKPASLPPHLGPLGVLVRYTQVLKNGIPFVCPGVHALR